MFKIKFQPTTPDAPLWLILLKIFCQTVIFWSLFLLVIPGGLMWLESMLGWDRFHFSGQRMWGILCFVLGGTLGLTSGAMMGIYGRGTPLPFDTARHLVIVGPYRYVRNPMAVAGLTQGAAVALFFGSWLTLFYIIVGFFLWNYWVRPIEEQDLLQRFDRQYAAYQRSVRCWIPCWRGYSPGARETQGNDK
ncbi:MAG: isoprenylcysteine carboxylmethyltransferase family protein [Planctomycetaceae bacterium]|nr:isoprenylcysteine carboxylmethyltransferase family protein [Planctomycetaceae bacterium]